MTEPHLDLTSPKGIRQRLEELQRKAKKGLGQHFLIDKSALEQIVNAAQLTKADTVLEVGPGLGVLTRELAKHAGKVIAVEIDPQLANALELEFQNLGNVQVICADILSLDLSQILPKGEVYPKYKLVAALPYFIASAILRFFLEAPVKPSLMVVTVQREVAENIVSKPGDMTILSVAIQLYGNPHIVDRLSPSSFYPRPKVDSAIVSIEVSPRPAYPIKSIDDFFTLVKGGFSSRRKQIHNALATGLRVLTSDAYLWLAAAGIDPQRRAQTLSIEEWFHLYQAWRRVRDE